MKKICTYPVRKLLLVLCLCLLPFSTKGATMENNGKEDALKAAIAALLEVGTSHLSEKVLKDKTAAISIENLHYSSSISDDRAQQIWDALIKAKYIDVNGVILPSYNPKKFKLPIPLTPEEKKNVLEILELRRSDDYYFPPAIRQKIPPPSVKSVTKVGNLYKVILYSLSTTDLEVPYKQESVIKWEVTVGGTTNEVKSKGVVWTTRRTFVY